MFRLGYGTIKIAAREDGGLRVWSDDFPGLVLSGPDQRKVLESIGPALIALFEHKQRNINPKYQ